MLLIPKMTGSAVPLPVKGRLPVAVAVGPIVVVVTGPSCAPSVEMPADTVVFVTAVEPDSRTVVGVVLVGAPVVEVGPIVVGVVVEEDEVVEDVEVDEVVEDVEVVDDDVVVVGPQSSTLGSEADAEVSGVRSGMRMVNLTVPLDGAGPLACQICTGPEFPVVS
jgi:hypothetical protein